MWAGLADIDMAVGIGLASGQVLSLTLSLSHTHSHKQIHSRTHTLSLSHTHANPETLEPLHPTGKVTKPETLESQARNHNVLTPEPEIIES